MRLSWPVISAGVKQPQSMLRSFRMPYQRTNTNMISMLKITDRLPRILNMRPKPARNSSKGKPIATGARKASGIRSYWEITFANDLGSTNFRDPAYTNIPPIINLKIRLNQGERMICFNETMLFLIGLYRK